MDLDDRKEDEDERKEEHQDRKEDEEDIEKRTWRKGGSNIDNPQRDEIEIGMMMAYGYSAYITEN